MKLITRRAPLYCGIGAAAAAAAARCDLSPPVGCCFFRRLLGIHVNIVLELRHDPSTAGDVSFGCGLGKPIKKRVCVGDNR